MKTENHPQRPDGKASRLAETANPTILAGCLTAGLFLALPYVHVVEPPQEPLLELTTIEQTDWQVPTPLPLPQQAPQEPVDQPLPKPELAPPEPHTAPLKAMLDFDLGLTDVGGDFDLNFSIEPTPVGLGGDAAFALSDVDRVPQPLVQLRPFYPAHARMRQIEGHVVVEFVVSPGGHAERIEVISSEPGNVFRTVAVRAVERWRFSPGTREGQPVAVRVRQTIRFQLEGSR